MINWGIIGAGDVAEVKSGPAFNLVKDSLLIAVMRRNEEKAKDFAKRHNVPLWYNNVDELLANTKINAVYIATPPSSHLDITKKALKSGKFVYLEKPMTLNLQEAEELKSFIKPHHKVVVAHYRRRLKGFLKVKELLDKKAIGKISHAKIEILQPINNNIIVKTDKDWRTNPKISGGGYFNDIAPHQLDLMRLFFGNIKVSKGYSTTYKKSNVDNVVSGIILFENEVQFQGIWNFTVANNAKKDQCIIYGDKGLISFSFYEERVIIKTPKSTKEFFFNSPKHIQKPLIEATVNYFLNKQENPCTVDDGLATLKIMDSFIN